MSRYSPTTPSPGCTASPTGCPAPSTTPPPPRSSPPPPDPRPAIAGFRTRHAADQQARINALLLEAIAALATLLGTPADTRPAPRIPPEPPTGKPAAD